MNTLKEKSIDLINDDEKAKALRGIGRSASIEEAVSDADLVQESIYEIYAKAERASRSNAIFASSLSYLLPREIQKALSNPERFIVAHPNNPPHLIPPVEPVPGQATSPGTIDSVFQFYKSLGKFPIVIKKELWGYIGNRLQDALAKEAFDIINSDVASIEDVDMVFSTKPSIRWSIYGIGFQSHFNSFSSVSKKM